MLSKKNNKKGFTLMEMLIVVAIIAVLIAIAIPTFTASLNKARVATDAANIRSGYATVMATILTEDISDDTITAAKTYSLNKDATVEEGTDGDYACLGNNEKALVSEIAGQPVTAWSKDAAVTYEYDPTNNTVTIHVGD